ncbi:OmpH family outer membrane protein [Paracoccus sp. 1_MG-2023]|uniref:OmpH family outer membrane protein n=1 Tax=unclassified Paracoccus (in: a-proteobacteria) TaxID=2688777 RepID=UPI001C0A5E39|nr:MULTISPECIES: OmpH family outer membrane protein [unclassified Paracoccus (in: a-proteobacteria)]MBU2958562.1 OmpH family outer membrane protein [Paracoccus sp. C2R09]MDO6667555.1 OmpH family outer membrane protein [Paracoccus sp. 1_MG-2023]
MKGLARAGLIAWLGLWPAALSAQDAEPLAPQMPGVDTERQTAPAADLPNSTIATGDGSTLPVAPILTLDQDALYLGSAWGLRAQRVLEAEGDKVAAENERLTEMLSAEEADLTERRAELPPAEFRRLAENFDLRATEIRRERAQIVQDLNDWAEEDRVAFFRAALPAMGQAMQDRGAVAVLDRRTVFVSLDAIDVTEDLIAVMDDQIGDGEGAVPLPDIDRSGQSGQPVDQQGE